MTHQKSLSSSKWFEICQGILISCGFIGLFVCFIWGFISIQHQSRRTQVESFRAKITLEMQACEQGIENQFKLCTEIVRLRWIAAGIKRWELEELGF